MVLAEIEKKGKLYHSSGEFKIWALPDCFVLSWDG